MVDYYAVLEVSSDASQEAIKKSYRALVKKYHPDVTTFDKKYAREKTNALNEAYSVLSDADKRKSYDKQFFKKAEQPRPEPKTAYKSEKYKVRTDEPETEASVVIVRVINLCNDYYNRLERLVIFESGHEVQNFNICEDLSRKFFFEIAYDYQYLLNYDLMHGEVSDAVVTVLWKLALSYTWGNSYKNAEKNINMAYSIIEPSANYYYNFMRDREQIIEGAQKEKMNQFGFAPANKINVRSFILRSIGFFFVKSFTAILLLLIRMLLPFILIWLFLSYADGCMPKYKIVEPTTPKIDIRNLEIYPPNKRILESADNPNVIIK